MSRSLEKLVERVLLEYFGKGLEYESVIVDERRDE